MLQNYDAFSLNQIVIKIEILMPFFDDFSVNLHGLIEKIKLFYPKNKQTLNTESKKHTYFTWHRTRAK